MAKKGAIWWSVDPFNDNISFHKKELAALLPIARAMSTVIQPVTYIDTYRALDGEGNILPLMPLYASDLNQIKEVANKRLKLIYKASSRGPVLETVFLTNNPSEPPSLQQRVESISKAALKQAALFVALRTHSRKGLKRFYMGSFAETFLLYTKVPTLVLRADTEASYKWKQVLFPTDFSQESKAALLNMLPIFAKTKSSLLIVHVCKDFLSYRFKSSDALDTYKAHNQKLIKLGEAMLKLANKAKVQAQFKLLGGGSDVESSEAIINLAKSSKSSLIAVAAKSSPLKTAIVGALTRKLVRNSYCPVLVYRS